MKILISLSYYIPNMSGLTLYARTIAESFAEKKASVTVLTSQYEKQLPLKDEINGVRVIRVPITFRLSKGPIMVGFLPKSIALLRDADVLNCHLPQFESSLLAIVARCFGKKIIVTYHTDLADEKSFVKRLIKAALFLSHFVTCSLADAIVVQTQDNAEHSAFLNHFKKKVVFIYPPVIPPASVSSETKATFAKKNTKKGAYYLGFLGRMASEKGIEYLLEALPKVSKLMKKKCVLLIAGAQHAIGEQVYQEKIQSLVAISEDSVVMLGSLSEEEKNAFYSSLDVFVLPSINQTEAFGMVQIEAMYCGTPVVATDLPGVRVPIQKTGMGKIVPLRDSDALAQAITEILKNPKKYRKDVSVVYEHFSLEKTIAAYQKLLQPMIHESN